MLTFHLLFSRIIPQNSLSLFCFFLLTASVRTVSTTTDTEFDFGTLTINTLKFLGDAHMSNGSFHLTRDLAVPNSGSGKILYTKPVRFRDPVTQSPASFSTFFSFYVMNLNPSSIGGGLAFVISSDDENVGAAGGSLGLVIEKETETLSEFVAVEFDTLMDVEYKDINGNHVGLDLNGLISSQVADLGGVDIDLKSGDTINAWIDYDGSSRVMNVSVSYSNLKPNEPILSINLDLDMYVNEFMYVGFSGSTQGSTEIHSIEWWSFSSSFDSNSGSSVPPPSMSNLMNPSATSTNSNSNSQPPSDSNSTSNSQEKSNKSSSSCHNQLCKEGAVTGVVTASAFVLAIFAGVLIRVYSKKFKKKSDSLSLPTEMIKSPKEFTYKELKFATKSFHPNRIIGNGAFGTVYKGIIPESGDIVAVKKCSHNSQGKNEFLSELTIIGTLRHRNLVTLQGWCHEKGEILLVYDIMMNGSLDKALFESRTPLPFQHRQKILLGVASALTYLHQECENQIIHRDIKSSNIMLDEAFNAKVGDFGLARQIEHDKSPDATVAAGTMGYLAPEYLQTGRASDKSDVFSYGAVVLEVASGRRPIEKEEVGYGGGGGGGGSSNLVEWVWSLHREGKLVLAADSRLEGRFDEGEMVKLLLIGLSCSNPDPMARPTMRSVVQMLVGEADVPMVPKVKPTMSFTTSHLLLSLQDSVTDFNDMINVSTSSDEDGFNGADLV